MKITLCVEGGAKGELRVRCKQAFSAFLSNAGVQVGNVEIRACGSIEETHKSFIQVLEKKSTVFLLTDSDRCMPEPQKDVSPWNILQRRRPNKASDEQYHLMVQCMENWFLADHAVLSNFYKGKIRLNALPGAPVESIEKADELLRSATNGSDNKKGPYHKGKHAFTILQQINPSKVTESSPWAKRFVDTLLTVSKEKIKQ